MSFNVFPAFSKLFIFIFLQHLKEDTINCETVRMTYKLLRSETIKYKWTLKPNVIGQ